MSILSKKKEEKNKERISSSKRYRHLQTWRLEYRLNTRMYSLLERVHDLLVGRRWMSHAVPIKGTGGGPFDQQLTNEGYYVLLTRFTWHKKSLSKARRATLSVSDIGGVKRGRSVTFVVNVLMQTVLAFSERHTR